MSSNELLPSVFAPDQEASNVLLLEPSPARPDWTSPAVVAWGDDEEDEYEGFYDDEDDEEDEDCLLYTSPSPRDQRGSRMPSSA